ncbi:MAG: hypothetical protein AB8G16_00135 [Gammaproteobacteria bacterium]
MRTVILLALVGIGVTSTSALSCKDRNESLDVFLWKVFEASDIVAFGLVERDGHNWQANIERVWKGELPPIIVLSEYHKPHREEGRDLIFAYGPNPDGRYVGMNCSAFLKQADTMAGLRGLFGPGERPRANLGELTVSWFLAVVLMCVMGISGFLYWAVRYLRYGA